MPFFCLDEVARVYERFAPGGHAGDVYEDTAHRAVHDSCGRRHRIPFGRNVLELDLYYQYVPPDGVTNTG